MRILAGLHLRCRQRVPHAIGVSSSVNSYSFSGPNTVVLANLAGLLLQSALFVQPDSVINSGLCKSCRMTLTTPVVLGLAGDTAGIFADTQIIRNIGRGGFLLPKISYSDRLLLYSRNGAFRRSVRFDSAGEGNVGATYVGRGDSIFVFNNARSQLVGVDLSRGSTVMSAFPGSIHAALRLADGRWVVNGIFRTTQTIGLPLHIVTSRGVTMSFGSRTKEHRPDRPLEGWRHVAAMTSRSVLSLSYTDPLIERWTLDGEYESQLRLSLPEFKPWLAGPRWSTTFPPYSVIDDLRVRSDGHIWLLVSVASPSWRTAMKVVRTSDGEMAIPADWTAALSSWILVVDGKSGELIFGARFSEYLRQFVSDTQVSALRGGPNSAQSIAIYTLASNLSFQRE